MDIEDDSPPIPAEYDAFRQEVRTFITEHAPRLRCERTVSNDAEADAVRAFVAKMNDRGYLAPQFDLSIDGDDKDPFKPRIVSEECVAVGAPMGVGNVCGVHAIAHFGTQEQKDHYIPRAVSVEHAWCQLFSEPDAGSDLASLRTSARRDGDHYVVNGSKIWSSYAQWADYGFLLARTDREAEKHAGISGFILDMRSPGVTIAPLKQITGDSDFSEVFFDDVIVPAENLIGPENDGWRIVRTTLEFERAMNAGVTRMGSTSASSADRLVSLAKAAVVNGRPAVEDASVRQDVARIYSQGSVLRSMNHLIRTRMKRGTLAPGDIPTMKVLDAELHLAANECAVQLFGSSGIFFEEEGDTKDLWHFQDAFLHARAYSIGGGTNEINRNVIAERGLGLPRERSGS